MDATDEGADKRMAFSRKLAEKEAEIARLRAALSEIASWTLPSGRDAQDVAIQALTAAKCTGD